VDKAGQTIDFLLTPTRDRDAAEAFLHKAIRSQGLPEKITIDQSGSNTAAITHYNKTHKTIIIMRHSKYLIAIFRWVRPDNHRAETTPECRVQGSAQRLGLTLPVSRAKCAA
jgi:transposase-like protein